MHPVMFVIPGWAFKAIVPLLILWGCYSLVVSVNRASPADPPPKRKTAKKGDAPADEPAPEAKPKPEFSLPADSPFNALVSIAIGLGVFAFAAPVTLTGSAFGKLLGIFKGMAHGPNWRLPWESLPIYSYGVMLGLSLVVGWYIVLGLMDRQYAQVESSDAKRAEFHALMADCYVATAFAAVAGARVLYILTNLSEFQSLGSMLKLRSGGLVAYGGFLGGLLGSIVYLRAKDLNFWKWADAAVPALGTGLTITRMGCYLYGCDFGRPLPPSAPSFLKRLGTFPHWNDNHGSPAWQQHVSMGFRSNPTTCERDYHGVWHASENVCKIPFSTEHSVPVHPTQLYESLMGFTIFAILMYAFRRKRQFEGQIFLMFGILYGVGRTTLEFIRDDAERGEIGPFSTSQFIGIVTTVIAIPLYVYLLKNGRRADPVNLFAPVPAPAPAPAAVVAPAPTAQP